MKQDIGEEIRAWLLEWYNELGYFGAFPSASQGGSRWITLGESVTPEEYKTQQNKKKEPPKGQVKTSNSLYGNMEEASKKKRKDRMVRSVALEGLKNLRTEYTTHWNSGGDALSNDVHIDVFLEDMFQDQHFEVRGVVDNRMRIVCKKYADALKKCREADPNFNPPEPEKGLSLVFLLYFYNYWIFSNSQIKI